MLVLYVFGRHPSHNFTYSLALQQEAAEWNDVIALPMNEGRPSTNKTVGGGLKWGNEAEIGLSRKVFLWFDMALRAKADDDSFLRVPQYLADLRTLPRRGLYWGLPVDATARKNNVTIPFYYFSGMLYTLARDVVQQLVSFEPVRRLVDVPYNNETEIEFFKFSMTAEDVMVGHLLRLEVRYPSMVFVEDGWCRYHVGLGWKGELVATPKSLALHIPPEDSYAKLLDFFGSNVSNTSYWRWYNNGLIKLVC
ncbi:UDP-Gal or UDP-GlcNAc-dependent glycosyltransferase [Trypanosoma grayi]|uniref:UDP-Gal or UDP-GlcNAc-dependent glycosyltransferase n=1 Tax=Trypanosoma grayi TaxID=71804 RepID=UPI0004F430EB|nr:UDP-Gal or UDP-GlcNAc-dependent glycosyltransferase [Trypanosoma grayi]KEG07023.1 UDP-Gal or UDP-GlcNAc-dependent glycosyltransferase [Trypanosoma grayi]